MLAAASDQANAPPAGAHRRRRRRCPVLPLLPAADFSSCLAHRVAVRCGARSHSIMSLHVHQLIQPRALGPLGLAPTMGFCPPATARIGSNRAAAAAAAIMRVCVNGLTPAGPEKTRENADCRSGAVGGVLLLVLAGRPVARRKLLPALRVRVGV